MLTTFSDFRFLFPIFQFSQCLLFCIFLLFFVMNTASIIENNHFSSFCPFSNRSLEITRTNGDKLNNGFTGEATNLLRSLINNRQIGITAVDTGRVSPQIRFYRDTQGTTIERTVPDCSILGNRTNMPCLDSKVRSVHNINRYIYNYLHELSKNCNRKFYVFEFLHL